MRKQIQLTPELLATKTTAQLRAIYYNYKKTGRAIPTVLNNELTQRIKTYDPIKQKFGKESHKKAATPKRQRRNPVQLRKTKSLRFSYYQYRKQGRTIPDDLNNELAARFKNYSQQLRRFLRPSEMPLSQRSDGLLRAEYRRQIKQTGKITDELNAVLARRWSNKYDAEKREFTKAAKKQYTPRQRVTKQMPPVDMTPQKPAPVPLYSNARSNKYDLEFNSGNKKTVISRNGASPYELVLADRLAGFAVVRKYIKPDTAKLLIVNLVQGNVVPEFKSGVFSVNYSPKHRSIYASKNGVRNWQIRPDGRVIDVMVTPNDTITIFASQQLTATTMIVKANGGMQDMELITLLDAARPIMDKENVTYAPATRPAEPTNSATSPAHADTAKPTTRQNLHVSTKRIKLTGDGIYSNVFVNGKKIIKNHVNTTLNTFFDGRLLGVNGIVTDDEKMPTRPVWKLYDTAMHEYENPQKSQFNKYKVFIMNIVPQVPDKLKLHFSNNTSVILKLEQYKSVSDKIFVIDKEKTK